LRVIAGRAKGTQLRSPSAQGTRPISDRSKEALFNILAPDVPECRFLDLFAGTGGVGIEALSRGAAAATFVEQADRIVEDLRYNLTRTKLIARARIERLDVFAFLRQPPDEFDIIFIAPPQWLGLWPKALTLLDEHPRWMASDARVVVQHDPKEHQMMALTNLSAGPLRTYGGVQFAFYDRASSIDD
jgi:16S rRNA (guanine966-N2)-methyltransferase